MNVINQVLNKLEQRGAHSAVNQDMVRTVSRSRGPGALRIATLIVLGAAVTGVLLWQWLPVRKPFVTAVHQVQHVPAALPKVSASAVPVGNEAPGIEVAQSIATNTGGQNVEQPLQVQQAVAVPSSPVISSLSPDSIYASTVAQPLVISGSGYTEATTVTLRTSAGKVYANRPIASLSDKKIVINVKFGNSPDKWTVELIDANGGSSGEYAFDVLQKPVVRARETARPAVVSANQNQGLKQVSDTQQAEAEYHKAVVLMQRGSNATAMKGFEEVLRLDANHIAARQALVALLLDAKRGSEAEAVLQAGLHDKPEQSGLAMMLARVQLERGAHVQAIATLEKYLPLAERNGDFRAFYAALLQRQNRHKEAIEQYQNALRQVPNNGVWMMGCGISLQAEHRTDEAKQMYQRSLESASLSAELQSFVRQKLKEL